MTDSTKTNKDALAYFDREILKNIVYQETEDLMLKSAIDGKDLDEMANEYEKYLLDISDNFMKIEFGLKDLSLVQHFLTLKNFPDELKDKGVNESDYLIHHLTSFTIQIVSTIDYIHHFVNDAARMGIPNNKCNYNSLRDHKLFKNSDLMKSLTRLHSMTVNLRTKRNGLIHSKKFPSDFFDSVDLFSKMAYVRDLKDETKLVMLDATKKKMSGVIKKINLEIQNLDKYFCEDLLPILNPIILHNIEVFKEFETKRYE